MRRAFLTAALLTGTGFGSYGGALAMQGSQQHCGARLNRDGGARARHHSVDHRGFGDRRNLYAQTPWFRREFSRGKGLG